MIPVENTPQKKELVSSLLRRKFLVGEEVLKNVEGEEQSEHILSSINGLPSDNDVAVIHQGLLDVAVKDPAAQVNWTEFERLRANFESGKNPDSYRRFQEYVVSSPMPKKEDSTEPESCNTSQSPPIQIVCSWPGESFAPDVGNFVQYYTTRFRSLEKILRQRQDFGAVTSISRIKAKRDKEHVVAIGMVNSISVTKNGNISLVVEDLTGSIKVILNKNKPELFSFAKTLVADDVIGIMGVCGQDVIFCNTLYLPDVPIGKEQKKCPQEIYAAVLSDIHVGSRYFLETEFSRFIRWISGEVGSDEQRDIAHKTRYIFVVGDLVDGVGIYPNQEQELSIPDIYDQYAKTAEFFSKIPRDKCLIIAPGNHDAVRLSEPQPPLYKDISAPLWALPNAVMVSNPSIVTIAKEEGFSGFDVLMYHGYSYDYYISNVSILRETGGYDHVDTTMKYLLQHRHLAPTHGSSLFVPHPSLDPMVISQIPDFFLSGHVHKCVVSSYRNVGLIAGSCFQAKTAFQEKVGHNPEPCRIPLVNLKTRETKILRFG